MTLEQRGGESEQPSSLQNTRKKKAYRGVLLILHLSRLSLNLSLTKYHIVRRAATRSSNRLLQSFGLLERRDATQRVGFCSQSLNSWLGGVRGPYRADEPRAVRGWRGGCRVSPGRFRISMRPIPLSGKGKQPRAPLAPPLVGCDSWIRDLPRCTSPGVSPVRRNAAPASLAGISSPRETLEDTPDVGKTQWWGELLREGM